MAAKAFIQISPSVARTLSKMLDAVLFNGAHEIPQEFWAQEEYAILSALSVRLRSVKKKKEKRSGC